MPGPRRRWQILLAALCLGVAAAPAVEEGQRAYDAGDFQNALRIWLPLAQAGDNQAQFDLGLLYDLGQGTEPNTAQARHWYMQAALAQLPTAEFNVAVLADQGRGGRRDASEAATWYARAATHGHARAQYNLGQLYEAGDGVPRNLDEAAVWYRAAAAGGLAAAQDKLDHIAALSRAPQPARRVPAAGLTPVLLMAPANQSTTGEVHTIGDIAAELVWAAPPEPLPVQFFVQVLAVERDSTREVFAGYVDRSAMLVALPHRNGSYVWRVYTTAPGSQDYAASKWFAFGISGVGERTAAD